MRMDKAEEARKIFLEEPILKWSYIDKCQWAMYVLLEENDKLREALAEARSLLPHHAPEDEGGESA